LSSCGGALALVALLAGGGGSTNKTTASPSPSSSPKPISRALTCASLLGVPPNAPTNLTGHAICADLKVTFVKGVGTVAFPASFKGATQAPFIGVPPVPGNVYRVSITKESTTSVSFEVTDKFGKAIANATGTKPFVAVLLNVWMPTASASHKR
jgi:hypothetical protein